MSAPHSDDVPANRRAFTFDDFDRQAVRGVDAIQNENPFGGRYLYNANIDNGLFFADVRWYVDGTMNDAETGEVIRPLTAGERSVLFNGSYTRGLRVQPGEQLDMHVWFSEDGTGRYPGGYPYGYLFLTYYSLSTAAPEQIDLQVYCNHEGQGVGWKILSAQPIGATASNFAVHRFRQSWHGISDIHLVITNDGDSTIEPNSFEHHVERRSSSEVELPFVSKLEDQRIYRRFTWRDENRNENAYIDEDGTAEFGRLRSATGPTTARPQGGLPTGTQFFDTTIGRPIWWDGGKWINASGGTV